MGKGHAPLLLAKKLLLTQNVMPYHILQVSQVRGVHRSAAVCSDKMFVVSYQLVIRLTIRLINSMYTERKHFQECSFKTLFQIVLICFMHVHVVFIVVSVCVNV